MHSSKTQTNQGSLLKSRWDRHCTVPKCPRALALTDLYSVGPSVADAYLILAASPLVGNPRTALELWGSIARPDPARWYSVDRNALYNMLCA